MATFFWFLKINYSSFFLSGQALTLFCSFPKYVWLIERKQLTTGYDSIKSVSIMTIPLFRYSKHVWLVEIYHWLWLYLYIANKYVWLVEIYHWLWFCFDKRFKQIKTCYVWLIERKQLTTGFCVWLVEIYHWLWLYLYIAIINMFDWLIYTTGNDYTSI